MRAKGVLWLIVHPLHPWFYGDDGLWTPSVWRARLAYPDVARAKAKKVEGIARPASGKERMAIGRFKGILKTNQMRKKK